MNPNEGDNKTGETPLQSWKEIGAYLQRNAVTVRRWEKEEGLPVHRHPHRSRSSVFAYPSELDAWRASRAVPPDQSHVRAAAPPNVWLRLTFALTLVLCLLIAGDGARPVSAQPKSVVKRLVCVDCADFRDDLSADGKSILGAGSNGDLAVWDLSDSSRLVEKPLKVHDSSQDPFSTFKVSVPERPLLSPDGRQIVYGVIDESLVHGELRLAANKVGAKPRVLAGGPEFKYFRTGAWSPDGKSVLVFAQKPDETWQIAWVSVADGSVKPVLSLGWRMRFPGRGPVLSPDGRYIAYAALPVNPRNERAGQTAAEELGVHIYVVAANGSAGSTIVKTAGINDHPEWSADGKHLLFTSNQSGQIDLWSVAMRDGRAAGSPVLVHQDIGSQVNFLGVRSGSYYYTERIINDFVYFADVNPGGPAPKESFVGTMPTWSPDGKSVAFKRPHAGTTRNDNKYDVVVHSLESGDERIYPNEIGLSAWSGPVVWTHDGTGLLVDVHKFGSDRNTPGMLYRVDVKTGAYREIPNTEIPGRAFRYGWLAWAISPGDKTVYFNRQKKGTDPAGVYAVDIAGGPARFVFAGPGGKFELSPNGRTLLWAQGSLVLAPVDGSNSREFQVRAGQAIWTRDGRAILFQTSASGKSRIMRMSSEGGEPEFSGFELATGANNLSLSPDGSRLAYSFWKGIDRLWALDNIASTMREAK